MNPGTQAAPKRTVNAGVATAVATGARDVYVATGTFNEGAGVNIASLLTVTGGYSAGTWYPTTAATTTITGNPQALLADGDTGFTLRYLTLSGTGSGGGVYGVRGKGSSFTLINVRSMAAKGIDGTGGATPPGSAASGGGGLPGDPGVRRTASASARPGISR